MGPRKEGEFHRPPPPPKSSKGRGRGLKRGAHKARSTAFEAL